MNTRPPIRSTRDRLELSGLPEGATGITWGGKTICRHLVENTEGFWSVPEAPEEVTVLFGAPGFCNYHRDLVRDGAGDEVAAPADCSLEPQES